MDTATLRGLIYAIPENSTVAERAVKIESLVRDWKYGLFDEQEEVNSDAALDVIFDVAWAHGSKGRSRSAYGVDYDTVESFFLVFAAMFLEATELRGTLS